MPAADVQDTSGVPQVSQDDLIAFHEAHFSQNAVTYFSGTFIKPDPDKLSTPPADDWASDGDDGLGYYEDGVKRTLTDEQIEIFRHSELQKLRKAEEKKAARAGSPTMSEGELSETRGDSSQSAPQAQSGPKKKKRKTNKQPREPKPDLRKRTWDVVEAGLDTLDYD